MKARSPLTPQLAFAGIVLIVLVWLVATVLFETHLGWPVGGIQWARRLLGWGVELWLIRSLIVHVGKYQRTAVACRKPLP